MRDGSRFNQAIHCFQRLAAFHLQAVGRNLRTGGEILRNHGESRACFATRDAVHVFFRLPSMGVASRWVLYEARNLSTRSGGVSGGLGVNFFKS